MLPITQYKLKVLHLHELKACDLHRLLPKKSCERIIATECESDQQSLLNRHGQLMRIPWGKGPSDRKIIDG